MKNSKILFFILIGILFSISSCRDDEDSIVEIIRPNSGAMIGGAVSGRVTNNNGFPISNATVSLQGSSVSTDRFGLYSFVDMQLMENQKVVLKVTHPNHFETSRAFTSSQNRSIVNFELILQSQQTFSINSNEEVNLDILVNGLTSNITIPPDAYVLDGTNIPYQGRLNISRAFIDPTNLDRINSIPGDLSGVDNNGEDVQLGSYSMIAVELESEDGQKLNLAEDKEATIKFAIPEELTSSAPSNIPLWYYDLETGLWKEEGSASLSADGNSYQGNVTHFSYWNCDVPYPLVNLRGRVVDETGAPQTGITVRITILNSTLTRYGQTDSDGIFQGKVPKGEELKVTYFQDYICDEYIDESEIGPFNNDVVLDDYIITVPDNDIHMLTGKLLDCQGAPSPSTFLLITYSFGTSAIIPDNEGNFSVYIPDCYGDFSLIGFDFNSDFQSEPIIFNDGIMENVMTPDILLCTEDLSFIEVNYEGNTYRSDIFQYNVTNESYTLSNLIDSTFVPEIDARFNITNQGTDFEVGEYISTNLGMLFSDPDGESHLLSCPPDQDTCLVNINIESFGEVGEFISGSYSGFVNDSNSGFPGLREVSGRFSALRLK